MHDFFSRAALQPERVALTFTPGGLSCTAGELATLADRIAHWLDSLGLQAGETFAVLLENRLEIIAAVLAARRAGLYATLINTHLTAEEIAWIVQDSDARLAIVSAQTLALLQPLRQRIDLPCWSVDGPAADAASLYDALQPLPTPPTDFSARPLGRDLLYSSGTTGRPKAVQQPLPDASYRNRSDPEVLKTARLMGMDTDTVYLSPAPLYHAAPLRYTLRALDLGGRVVVMERFDPAQALALIEEHRVTHSQWVPTMLARMLALPQQERERYDLSSHKLAIHAAAPCPVPLKYAILDWWGDILLEYYAGSEACGTTMIDSAEWRLRPGSVGRATSGCIHILDEDGRELPPGEVGQIYFSGGGRFHYRNDAEKTSQAINDKGWGSYGDFGWVDEQGYLFLSDRRADLIISGGVNIYPREIENALALHPAVAELAVVGIPHPDFGEQPLAVVVLREGFDACAETAAAILAHGYASLNSINRPRRLVFTRELPRLETGKLLRRTLKQHYSAAPPPGYVLTKS